MLGATPEEKDNVQGVFTELPQKGSLIHHWARLGRRRGVEFWEPFLTWVLSRFEEEKLKEQAFLPTGTTSLSRLEERVMVPPLASAHQQEPARSEIPLSLFEHLHFLDERCIRLRKDNGELNAPGQEWIKDYQRSAHAYFDIDRHTLMRPFYPPTRERLLNTALPQALEAAVRSRTWETCFDLLKLVFQWSLEKESQEGVTLPTVYLPTHGDTWKDAKTLVLGKGWCAKLPTEPLQEAVLEPLYAPSGRRLLAWSAFAFEYLKQLLPGFSLEHWRSPQRVTAGFSAPDQPATGFHFHYLDETGALVQPPGQSCYVFVCGFRGELEPWQRLPGEAWLKAMECHTTEGQCFL
ncbi:MAG: hypothetical protein ACKO6N_11960, partial [Myxococcota bacterium]